MTGIYLMYKPFLMYILRKMKLPALALVKTTNQSKPGIKRFINIIITILHYSSQLFSLIYGMALTLWGQYHTNILIAHFVPFGRIRTTVSITLMTWCQTAQITKAASREYLEKGLWKSPCLMVNSHLIFVDAVDYFEGFIYLSARCLN